MDKKTLIAFGTGLALSLASITGCADTSKNMQAKAMESGYKNKSVNSQGKCGANKSEKMDGKCGANKAKKTEGKCSSGKCGANKK